ncbi:MAG TPA: phosphate ABC transporter substrate-binding protein PstS [Actinomycetota bacterium]|nr:phosphate ABC transporter substrate-binding protein PstS [Actinomycetota bacterium]
MGRFRRAVALAFAAALAGVLAVPGSASADNSHALISGSGSSWSANAVNQWIADVQQYGWQVVYTSVGSAQGRKDFAYKTTDYAVSDIGYQGVDPATGDQDTSLGRAYVYLPIVAGGTAFPYQVRVAGQLVRNIRLSGLTLAKIFTNQITNWNDPAITADNNGRKLPSIPIIPIVHSEGSGSTAQFTRWLAKEYPSLWRPYSGSSTLTEYYPRKGAQIAQNGSDGVMNFISSSAANGAIGYDEYSYALGKDYPVVKLENRAGYFTAPTQYNVAVALTQAKINLDQNPNHCTALGYNTSPCYLLQNLDKVYTYDDPRTYPMSSYSYMIIPTASDDPRMTTAKRQTLADYITYSICGGQAEMGPIGYSPLPINLVQASFNQLQPLKKADPNVDVSRTKVSKCHNPTFDPSQPGKNHLAEIAPLPPSCDRAGNGPCDETQGIVNGNPGTSGGPGGRGGGTTGSTGGGSTGGSSGPTSQGSTPGGGSTAPTTGGGSSGSGTTQPLAVIPEPITIDRHRSAGGGLLAVIAALEFLAILALPPLIVGAFGRRKTP